jgi:hypothetical protein
MLNQQKGKRVILDVSPLPTTGDSNYIYHNTGNGFFYYWNDISGKYVKLESLNVITTVQPTPSNSGNTTNLNSTFKDANGDTWIVDSNGDAIKAGGGNTGDKYKTTSSTCNNIVSTGNLTFTVAPNLAYTTLQDIIIVSNASSANHMHGEVVSYNSLTGELVVAIKQKQGSGNYCDWTVNLDAIKLNEVSVYFGSNSPLSAGQVGIEGDLWYKTSNGTNSGTIQETWVYDGTTWVLVDVQIPSYATVVFFNSTNPATATIFDTENPPLTNDDGLKNLDSAIYIGTNGSTWNSNGTVYSTYIAPASTEWYLSDTTIDAGSNKTSAIYRLADVGFGHSSPKQKVDINGTLLVRSGNDSFLFTKNQILFGYNSNNNYQHVIRTRHSSTNQNGNAIDFFLWNQGTDTSTTIGSRNVVTMMGNGSVGINNNAPTVPIDVNAIGNAAYLTIARFLAPSNNIVGNHSQMTFGTSQGAGNCSDWRFYYAGNGSLNNRIDFGMSGRFTPMISYLYNGYTGINNTTPLSFLDVNGSFGAITRGSSVSTTTSGDHTVLMAVANTTCTLESPTSVSRRIMVVKNTSLGNINVTGHIDGTASTTIVVLSKESIQFQSDGTTWQIIAKYNSPKPIAVSTNLNIVSIASGVITPMTSYTNVSDTSNGAWNNTTGIFTCNKAGLYRFEFRAMFAQSYWTQSQEINAMFYKNNVLTQNASWFISSSYTQYAFSGHNFINLNLVVGDTIQVRIWHNGGSTKTTYIATYSTFLINEIR